jgi:hypothetical protein
VVAAPAYVCTAASYDLASAVDTVSDLLFRDLRRTATNSSAAIMHSTTNTTTTMMTGKAHDALDGDDDAAAVASALIARFTILHVTYLYQA